MAYQALYRKYRSQRFDEMVGQRLIERECSPSDRPSEIINHKILMN